MIARNRKDVILSAGAINCPQILMLSGIGPKQHLNELGIPLKVDLPVGRNLQDHVAVQFFFEFPLTPEIDPKEMLDKLYQMAVHSRESVIEADKSCFIAQLSSISDTRYPDYQIQFTHFRRGDTIITNFINILSEPAHGVLRKKKSTKEILFCLNSACSIQSLEEKSNCRVDRFPINQILTSFFPITMMTLKY